MSIFSAAERLSAIDHSTVTLNTGRCLHSHDRFSACSACFDICPVSAIITGKPPLLDQMACQTCLACLPACPTGAFAADDAVSSLLNCASRLDIKQIELVCEKHPASTMGPSEEVIAVQLRGCLAGLGSSAYLCLVAIGIETISVRLDHCATCQWGLLHSQIQTQLSHARRLLEPWKQQAAIDAVSEVMAPVSRPCWQADNPPISRRDLFRLAATRGQVTMARALDQGRSGHSRHPNRDRLRLLGAIRHLPKPTVNSAAELSSMGFARLTAAGTCTACGVCERACPTLALHFETDASKTNYQLTFQPQLCIGCERCAHVCVPNALDIHTNPNFAQIFDNETETLISGTLARCPLCKAYFATNADTHLCPQCDFRRRHPFGQIHAPKQTSNQAAKAGENQHDH